MLFFLQKNGRIYEIGKRPKERLCEIHETVLATLKEWNGTLKQNDEYDFPFALAILLSLVPAGVSMTDIDVEYHDSMNFVFGMC